MIMKKIKNQINSSIMKDFCWNPDRYFELDQKEFSFLLTNENLTESEKLEHSNYSYSRQYLKYLWWEEKRSCLILIEDFINSQLNAEYFSEKFERLWHEKQKLRTFPSLERLQAVRIEDPLALESFWLLIHNISFYSDIYENSMDEDEINEISFQKNVTSGTLFTVKN